VSVPYKIDLQVDGKSVKPYALAVLEQLAEPPWPKVTEWAWPPEGGKWRTDPIAPALKARKRATNAAIDWVYEEFGAFSVGQEDDRIIIGGTFSVEIPGETKRWLAESRRLIAALLAKGVWITSGRVERMDHPYCLPRHEIVGAASHIAVTGREGLEWSFERPDEVITQGGWEAENINDFFLMTRAMEAETGVQVLEAIQDGQWAMARNAKPGMMRYNMMGPPDDDEVPIFRSGTQHVLSATYDARAKVATYSCTLGPAEHVHGWEIMGLRDCLRDGRLPSGKPVKAIEVVFPDEATARREARPLLDVGVRVAYYGAGGEREALPG
jgi:hypothetical protein